MKGNEEIKTLFYNQTIDSLFVFENGDFIIFDNYGHSILYDKETLNPKITLEVSIRRFFYYLTEEEFGLYTKNKYKIFKFKNNRTEYYEIHTFELKEFEEGNKLMRLSNSDILFFKYYKFSHIHFHISIYKKDKNNNNDSYLYEIQEQYNINECDEIIEINKKEILGYTKKQYSEILKLFIIYNDNYKIKKENSIKMEVEKNKKRLYFTTKIFETSNKLICGGCYNIYIIDLDCLELETTINLPRIINKIIIRPNGNLFILTYKDKINETDIFSSSIRYYYINSIKINFEMNELIENKEIDILGKEGIHCSLFDLYNYPNNGIIFIIDKYLIIFNNYNEIKDEESQCNQNKFEDLFNNLKQNSFQLSKILNPKVNDENFKITNYSNNPNLKSTNVNLNIKKTNKIRIGKNTRINNVLKYCYSLLKEKAFKTLIFSAVGKAIGKLVFTVEALKILNPGLYQQNKLSSITFQYTETENKEKKGHDSRSGNSSIKNLCPKMEIILSLDDFEDKNEGYQEKLKEDERKKIKAIFIKESIRKRTINAFRGGRGFTGRLRFNGRRARGGLRTRGYNFMRRGFRGYNWTRRFRGNGEINK